MPSQNELIANLLSVSELDDLNNLESIIDEGQQTFVSVGVALLEIRDRRLYRARHGTFEFYCQKKWGWGARRANQLMDAAVVVQALPKQIGNRVSDSKAACELAKIPPQNRISVAKTAAKSGVITSGSIREAASKNGDSEKPTIQLDKEGKQIPDAILADWQKAEEVGKKIWSMLGEVKALVSDLDIPPGKREPASRELSNTTMSDIEALRYSLKQMIPHAVCDTCQGRNFKSCTRCYGRGFLSKFLFEQCSPGKKK
jgi:hypothetical protein